MASGLPQNDMQMVTFVVADEEYAINVMAVREIIDQTEITKTVNGPSHLEGIINLRGAVIPVISLRTLFGLPPLPDDIPGCIAVIDCGSGQLRGFIIDDVSDVIRVRPDQIQPPLEVNSESWISGILNWNEKLVLVVHLDQIA